MVVIRPLAALTLADLKRVASGYSSDSKYLVAYTDSEDHTSFDLRPVALPVPYVKAYDHFGDESLERYGPALGSGFSCGALEGDVLVGLAIAEPDRWNRSVWVWEFHVAQSYRRQGIGGRLMEYVVLQAKREGLRSIVCETQNTNATAIQVYRRLGFRVEGVDISYYSNHDYPDGEIAVFMKRRVS